MITMSNLENEKIDLVNEFLGWGICDELDELVDVLYEEQLMGRKPDLNLLKITSHCLLNLWKEAEILEQRFEGEEILDRNKEVLMIAMMTLWGASMTIEDFTLI